MAAVDRDAHRLRDVAKSVAEEGGRVDPFPADVTSSADVESLVDDVEALVGPLDFLVNAAMCCGWPRHAP